MAPSAPDRLVSVRDGLSIERNKQMAYQEIGISKDSGVLTVRFRTPRNSSAIEHYRAQLERYIGIILVWADGSDTVMIAGLT